MFIQIALDITNNGANARNAGLAGNYVGAANTLLEDYRPWQLADMLDQYWRFGVNLANFALGGPAVQLEAMARPLASQIDPAPPASPLTNALPGWHHLVYAYMLENTRMYEIFRRVLDAYVHGERLPRPSAATLRWLQNTEELFFSSNGGLTVRSRGSRIRPDDCAQRRNLYQRVLGMDLNHGTEDGRPYEYRKSEAANRDFVILWETLLGEAWKGFTNRLPAFSAEASADEPAMLTLVTRLEEMLMSRRLNGTLSREEFDAVACMSWLRLVISDNTQVVQNLTAQAAGEADRLKAIGELVGLSAHTRTDAYLRMAAPMSAILRDIENGNIRAALNINPAALYAMGSPFSPLFNQVITHWSVATGRNLKTAEVRAPLHSVLTDATRINANGSTARAVSRIPTHLMR